MVSKLTEVSSKQASTTSPSQKLTGFESPDYIAARDERIRIIKSISVWDSIDRYANTMALTFLTGGAMSKALGQGKSTKSLVFGAIGALATFGMGLFAHYKKRLVLEPVDIAHREAHKVAEAQILGQEMGKAVAENLNQSPPTKNWQAALAEQATQPELESLER